MQKRLKMDDPETPTLRSQWGDFINKYLKKTEDY
jgi:hypothetical protein